MRDARIDEVIEFWFGTEPVPSEAIMRRWFMRDAAFDAEIRTRYGALHAEAAAGGLDDWRGTARGELALLVVLDQFSRNLYRDDPRAFAQDTRALTLARELIASGRARELTLHQRMVATMPFQHAEDLATQREAVELFEQLVTESPDDPMLKNGLVYAKKHAEIIDWFGRFPHRNKTVGRPSTPEELSFLEKPGSGF